MTAITWKQGSSSSSGARLRYGRDPHGARQSPGTDSMEKAARTNAVGYILDWGQEAKTEIVTMIPTMAVTTMRICVRMLCVLLVASSLCQAAGAPPVVYVINRKPPSVASVSTDTWKPGGKIRIDSNPTHAVLHPNGRYLYVLHHGLHERMRKQAREQSSLSVIDLAQQKVAKRIPLGWNPPGIATIAKDWRYLTVWAPGRTDHKRRVKTGTRDMVISESAPKGGNRAYLTFVELQGDHPAFSFELGPAGSKGFLAEERSCIITLAHPELKQRPGEYKSILESKLLPATGIEIKENWLHVVRTAPRTRKAELRIFSANAQRTPELRSTVELNGWPDDILVSRDARWLYVLDFGVPSKKKDRFDEGKVQIIEVDSGRVVATRELGPVPGTAFLDSVSGEVVVPGWSSVRTPKTKLHRFRGREVLDVVESDVLEPYWVRSVEGLPDRLIVARDQLCRWPIGSSSFSACIPLKSTHKAGSEKESVSFDEVPGLILHLAERERLVLASWALADRLGIVDLRRNRLEHALTTGREGVKFGKALGLAALSGALSGALSAIPVYSSFVVALGLPVTLPGQPGEVITARSDGRFLYAYNGMSDDVTIVETETGKVIDKIPVGGGCPGIGFGRGKRLLWAPSSSQITVINADSNKREHQHPLSGTLNGFFFLRSVPCAVALVRGSVLAFNVDSGNLIMQARGYPDPVLIVEPVERGTQDADHSPAETFNSVRR